MNEQSPTLTLRYMRSADIPEVVAIDRASFDPPWPPRSYQFEINESTISFMVVLQRDALAQANGIKRLLGNLRGQEDTLEWQSSVVGYGGLWKIQQEAHISTIASHPDYRGAGYGEILLAGMIRQAIRLRASYVVLEVRLSNRVAQRLYRKYGFKVTGVKEQYYRNNGEDAYDMRLDLTPESIAAVNARYDALCEQHHFTDKYAAIPHPRGIE